MFGIGKKKDKAEAPAAPAPAESTVALQPAGFWLRFVALIVDSALMMILLAAMVMAGASIGGEEMAGIAYLAWILVSFLYWPVMESTPRRATFGKMLLGLVVADVDGGKLSFVRSLLRNLAKIISAIPLYIGFLLAAFTARKQALHDLITKAVVLRQGAGGFARAIGVLVLGILLFVLGGYLAADYLMGTAMKDMQAIMSGEPPAPAKPPVMARPAPKPAPKPAPVVQAPSAPPPAPVAPAPAPAAKPAAPAPVVQAPPPPPPPAPVAKPAPKPAPEKVAAAPKPAPVMQERKPEPPPAPKVAPPPPPPPAPMVAPPPPATPAVSPRFNDVMTAVLYGDRDTVSQLLDLGRWADKRDSNGLTPLMVAAMNGDLGMTRLLLDRGADPGLQAPGGATALEFARQSNDAATMQLLQRAGAR
jgi:uncharacterized RDD family membrane protein YckC